jgi:hypothetical protein
MKKAQAAIVYVFMALMMVSASPVGNESAAGGGQPSAVFHETSFTFSPVPEGMEVKHDYPVVNQGSADLEITRIETT